MEPVSSKSDPSRNRKFSPSSGTGDRDGGGGRGFPSSFPNSLNSLSNPGCICLAIIGKWASNSPKVLISFFGGEIVPLGASAAFALVCRVSALGAIPGTMAGVIFAGSNEPINGLEMEYISHGCESLVGA